MARRTNDMAAGRHDFEAHIEVLASFCCVQSKAMSSYGYSIVQVLVTDILPDQKVRNAMNEINAASRLRYRTGLWILP